MKSITFGLLLAGALTASPVFAAQGGLGVGVGADANVGVGAGSAGVGTDIGAGARTNTNGIVGGSSRDKQRANASGAAGVDSNANGAVTLPKRKGSHSGNASGAADVSGSAMGNAQGGN